MSEIDNKPLLPQPVSLVPLSNDNPGGDNGTSVKGEDAVKERLDAFRAEFYQKLSEDKASLITVLGIFVSIFTFISVEIQVLKYVCDFDKIVGLTLVIPGILILFNCSLDYLARAWIGKGFDTKVIIPIVIAVALISYGCYMTKSPKNQMCQTEEDRIEEIRKQYKEEESHMKEIRNKYEKSLIKLSRTIKVSD